MSSRSPIATFQLNCPMDSAVSIPLPLAPLIEMLSVGFKRFCRRLGSITRTPKRSSMGTASNKKSLRRSFSSETGFPWLSRMARKGVQ
ncbi:hypothetical protein EVA_11033 [gut metagenome]|uniref:Uncharacterized protein n=1 Tax=gut metagenome TaxID=749906 RepID=J9GGD3_9ZZZZ